MSEKVQQKYLPVLKTQHLKNSQPDSYSFKRLPIIYSSMKINFVHHILFLGRLLVYTCVYWIENAFFFFTASSPLGRFKNKTGQSNSTAQKKSILCCGYRATGPTVKAMTAWFFWKRILKCPWSGWLYSLLTGDTAEKAEFCLPSAWKE